MILLSSISSLGRSNILLCSSIELLDAGGVGSGKYHEYQFFSSRVWFKTTSLNWITLVMRQLILVWSIFRSNPRHLMVIIHYNTRHIMMEMILDFRHVFHMPVVCGAHMDPIWLGLDVGQILVLYPAEIGAPETPGVSHGTIILGSKFFLISS